MDPGSLPKEIISRICWAVSDSSGAIAEVLADQGREAPIEWLRVLLEEKVLERSSGERIPGHVPLVDNKYARVDETPIDKVSCGLARWLSSHLDKRELVEWVVEIGGHLHPEFAHYVRRNLESDLALKPAIRRFWDAITSSGDLLCSGGNSYRKGCSLLKKQAGRKDWDPLSRVELLRVLEPCITLRRNLFSLWYRKKYPSNEPNNGEVTLTELVSVKCGLAGGAYVHSVLQQLRLREDWPEIIAGMTVDLLILLKRSLELMACFDRVSREWDRSYSERPSIADDDQNRRGEGWVILSLFSRICG